MLPDTAQSFRGTLYIHVWIRFLNWKKKKNHKKKEGNAPRDKRIFEIIRQRIFLKTFPFGPVYFYSGVSYNCNLLTLQISIDILSKYFNKQSFTLMLHFIYFHLIHLCCKLSVILISPVIPLLIVPSGYVIRGGALTSRKQTSDVKSPTKCNEWGKIGWPVHL